MERTMGTAIASVLNRNSVAASLRELTPEERRTRLSEILESVAAEGCSLCGGPLADDAETEHACCPCLDGGFQRLDGKAVPCACRLTGIPEQEFLRRSGIPETMAKYSLETWGGSTAGLEAAATYLEKWPPAKGLLLLTGPVGSGKSGFAVAIARGLWMKHHKVASYVRAKDLMDRVFASFTQNRLDPDERFGETTEDIHRKLATAPLLILDDLGTEHSSSLAYTETLGLIDQRAYAGKPLIVTSNYDPRTELDRRIGSRLQDTERGTWLRFKGEDRRVGERS